MADHPSVEFDAFMLKIVLDVLRSLRWDFTAPCRPPAVFLLYFLEGVDFKSRQITRWIVVQGHVAMLCPSGHTKLSSMSMV